MSGKKKVLLAIAAVALTVAVGWFSEPKDQHFSEAVRR